MYNKVQSIIQAIQKAGFKLIYEKKCKYFYLVVDFVNLHKSTEQEIKTIADLENINKGIN